MTNAFGVSRRSFLVRTALIAGGMATGVRGSRAQTAVLAGQPALRVLFATDAHLMVNDALRSEQGLVACLQAVEELRPAPDFCLFGGDLTHESPELDLPAAERLLDRFLTVWHAHTTGLLTFFTFGNHDLAGTKNRAVDRDDPRFGKGLFHSHLGLDRLSYAFEKGGWRFIVLDDVIPEPDGSYLGEFADRELGFLRSELEAHPQAPTVICTHIPAVSVLPNLGICGTVRAAGTQLETPASLVVSNARDLHRVLVETKANVRLVLAGHLHHLEQIEVDGIRYLTGGAVCGNWWKGAQNGCPEGFTLLDLHQDGTVRAEYQGYGWKAAAG